MTRMLDRRHIWNLISNARSNRYHDPTSPNTAPGTKYDTARFQRKSPKTGETSFPMRGRSDHDPSMIRPWSDHDPSMIRPWKRKPQPASQVRLLFQLTTSIFYCKIQRFAPNLTFKPSPNTAPTTKRYTWPSPSAAPRKVTLEVHQVLRLQHKMTRMLDRRHIWNLISNARSNRYHDPTSPNTAPGTKYDTARFQRKSPKTGETSFPMRGRSDHDPTMIRAWSDHENANRNPPRKWGYFSSSPRAFSIVKYNVSRPILHSNLHNTAPATKSDTWTSPSTAPATKSDTWTSPSTAPATKSDTRTSLLYSTRLYLTLPYLTLLYLTLLDTTLLDSTWLYLILLDSTWFYSTRLYLTLLYSTWLYLILLDSSWLYLILLDSSWLYSTRLYLTLLYSTWLYLTLLDSTWLYSTWLYLTLLYLTLLDFNLTGMSFVYRKFLS